VTSAAAKATETHPKPRTNSRFVARQPILTKEQKVFGYELLFRDGVENYFCPSDAEAASRSTVDTSMLMRLDVLCDGRRAFVNCTRDMLLKDYITLLPSQLTIVEILEWVEADELVVNYIRMLQTVSKPELDSHEVKTSSKVKRPFAIAFCGI
jgi:c-di-GMP-related signal transduction protein